VARWLLTLGVLLACLPATSQEAQCLFQKCYGSGSVLLSNVSAAVGQVEVAVRNILCSEADVRDKPLAGRLVFRAVTPALDPGNPRVPVQVVMHDAARFVMENPHTVSFSGPATLYLGSSRRGFKGTLQVEISDRRDPTDAFSPTPGQFDTISMTFVPETSPLPYQLSWQGIVWKGDLVVFERRGR